VIIRLTETQCQRLRQLYNLDVNTWLDDRQPAAGTVQSWDVTMPASGWRWCLQQLQRRVEGPRGGILKAASKAQVIAMRRIATGLARLEAHPALRDTAVADNATDVLYVWHDTVGWTIYPVADKRMFVMWPQRVKWAGMMVTRWEMAVPVGGGLADEREHLVFVELPSQDARQVVGHRPVEVGGADPVVGGDVE
jgi:hypothetical protein